MYYRCLVLHWTVKAYLQLYTMLKSLRNNTSKFTDTDGRAVMFRLCENDITSRQMVLMFIEEKTNSGEVTCRWGKRYQLTLWNLEVKGDKENSQIAQLFYAVTCQGS